MKQLESALDGVRLIELALHGDARGFFVERYHKEKLRDCGIEADFVQVNHSRSAPGILRGLHGQANPAQGKLVGCVRGRIWDVAVDLRAASPTFGQHVGYELSDENARLLWIPPGFGHGFCVLGDEPADVLYQVTGSYNPHGEYGVRYDDPELAIAWPISEPTISARDQAQPSFAEYKADPKA